MLINKIYGDRFRVIHIAHNTFDNFKLFTLFPKNIIAVSNAVKKNLTEYFDVDEKNITVIYNGVEDVDTNIREQQIYLDNSNNINILMIGRLCRTKQQVELVKNTKSLLNKNINIYFAGEGEMLPDLKKTIGSCKQYHILGHIDVMKELYKYDYVCLFSQKEGLGNVLIEACVFGKPMVTNDVEAVLEINKRGYNGFVAINWVELVNCINSLPDRTTDEYKILSSNARKQYLEYFTLEKMIFQYRNYFNLYESILKLKKWKIHCMD
jgi:glycosyltransferase involved in cell wall biosynthesis